MDAEASTSWPEVSSSGTPSTGHADTALCTWYNIFMRDIFGGLVIVVGLVGNGLTIVIMGRDRRKSSTIRMLFYLAIVDSLILIVYGIIAMPTPLLKLQDLYVEASNHQVISISVLSYVGQTLNQISVLFTLIVTWQRYVSIYIPLKAKIYTSSDNTNKMAVAATLFAVIFFLPNFFHNSFTTDSTGELQPLAEPFSKNSIYQMIYSISLLYLFSYVGPIVALIVMGTTLLQNIRDSFKKKATMKAKEELTLSLVGVILIFIICQSISPLRRILMWVYAPYHIAVQCGNVLFFFGPIYLISFLVNSAANFIIYVLFARGFRRKVFKFIRRNRRVDPVQQFGLSWTLAQNTNGDGGPIETSFVHPC
ncbi:hypothetical protein CAPTEDRAFT_190973 [Capitella teleta]|uniref:G-protein coupled receptors family 1 profile domain-containing protein n=1 Tax=Capitella teleta TaxID=283909 RepID=R7TJ23_CAPTE|nr:hypothetical protein CAPTEDRAFT_190973 [Capitella teleta]|eukprot:ELT93793.1 hypothetical protein CAPTEDRAFT_190973 [Capitella teleta]